MDELEGVGHESRLPEVPVGLMGVMQLLGEGGVRGIREHSLLVEDREDTHGLLLDQVDGVLQIETVVDEAPFDLLVLVLLLFEGEHVVVEELLQLLVGVVDAQLLERVVLEDLETGNVEHTNEVCLLLRVGQCEIDLVYNPVEQPGIDGYYLKRL